MENVIHRKGDATKLFAMLLLVCMCSASDRGDSPKGNVFDVLRGSPLVGGGDIDSLRKQTRYTLVYVSAHWCPPCRGFTPKFAEWYKQNHTDLDLDVVFLSCDRSQKDFDAYFSQMPWKALSYASAQEIHSKGKLDELLELGGIPHVSLIDNQTGEILTNNARGDIEDDPRGQSFPWKQEHEEEEPELNPEEVEEIKQKIREKLDELTRDCDYWALRERFPAERLHLGHRFRQDKRADFIRRLKTRVESIINEGDQQHIPKEVLSELCDLQDFLQSGHMLQ